MKYDNVKIPKGYYRIMNDIKAQTGDLYLNITNFPNWTEWCFIDENNIYLNDEADQFQFIIRKERDVININNTDDLTNKYVVSFWSDYLLKRFLDFKGFIKSKHNNYYLIEIQEDNYYHYNKLFEINELKDFYIFDNKEDMDSFLNELEE